MKPSPFLILLAVSTLGFAACGSDAPTATTSPIEGVQIFRGLSEKHTTGTVDYPQSPPAGGEHDPGWQNCGVYDAPIPNGPAVHSLQHGAVWLTYRPDLPAAQVAIVAAFAAKQSHVLVSPYPGLTEAVVASGWGVQLRLDSVTDPRLAEFVQTYQQGPQTPESGATCAGGFGNPIG